MIAFAAADFHGHLTLCDPGTRNRRAEKDATGTLHVDSFAIDRDVTSCDDYQRCIDAGACPDLERSRFCSDQVAVLPHDDASAYCAWRGLQLQSLAEWQRASELEGRIPPSPCEGSPRDYGRCIVTTAKGFVYANPSLLDAEWSRDTDCPGVEPGKERGPLEPAGISLTVALGRPKVALQRAEFRCSKLLRAL